MHQRKLNELTWTHRDAEWLQALDQWWKKLT
jgi:hypothetical protein